MLQQSPWVDFSVAILRNTTMPDGTVRNVLAFTDRPEREAQTWDASAFLDAWVNEFGDDPPNAVVSADGVRVAVTLSDPRVGMGEVTFTATPLPGQAPPTSVITQPTLFIDDIGICPGFGFGSGQMRFPKNGQCPTPPPPQPQCEGTLCGGSQGMSSSYQQ